MILALKLVLTPFFIAMVTLAGRRWGPAVSGLLMGLPLTSGPVSLILALQHGVRFASGAAIGTICGQASVCIFCLVYSVVARRCNWAPSLTAAIACLLVATLAWNRLHPALLPAIVCLSILIGLVLRLIPRADQMPRHAAPPRWDLPARMILAATFVVLLTGFAQALGPQLSGLLSPFPVFGSVLAAFTHQQQGPGAAARLLSGVVAGSCSFGCFFLIAGGLLPVLGIGWTYLLASLAAIGVNAILLAVTKRGAA